MSVLLPVHIAAGSVGILSGTIAIATLKGGVRHQRSGLVFVVSMIVMASIAATMSLWPPVNPGNVLQSLLTIYLVLTGLRAVRTREYSPRGADRALTALGLGVAASHVTLGVLAVQRGSIGGYDAPMFFVFGSIALLATLGDARALRAGPLRGTGRLVRHLWRMCFALFIANGSFFLGQSDEFPEALRVWPVLIALALFPLAAMAYWIWRVRVRRSLRGLVTADAVMASTRRALDDVRAELLPQARAS